MRSMVKNKVHALTNMDLHPITLTFPKGGYRVVQIRWITILGQIDAQQLS